MADFGYTPDTGDKVSKSLESNNWVDRRSRALIIQFILFNGNTDLLSVVNVLFEKIPTGGILLLFKVSTIPLYTADTNPGYMFYRLCHLVFLFFVLAYLVVECWEVCRNRRDYFRNIWKLLEWFIILICIAITVLYIVKALYTSDTIQEIHTNPYNDFSFDYITTASETEDALFGLLMFLTTVKLLKLLRFNPHIVILSGSMKLSAWNLISFAIVFVVICLAFAQLGILVFGSQLEVYSNVYHALISELHLVLGGDMHHEELIAANRIIGPLYIFVFILFVGFVFINMFFAILNEARFKQKRNLSNIADDLQFVMFAKQKLKTLFGFPSVDVCDKKEKDKEADNNVVEEVARGGHYLPTTDENSVQLDFCDERNKLTVLEQRKRSIEIHKQKKEFDFSEMLNTSSVSTNRGLAQVKRSQKRNYRKYNPVLSNIYETNQIGNPRREIVQDVKTLCYKISSMEELVELIGLDYASEDVELMRVMFHAIVPSPIYEENYNLANQETAKRRRGSSISKAEEEDDVLLASVDDIEGFLDNDGLKNAAFAGSESKTEDRLSRSEPKGDFAFEENVRGVFPIIKDYKGKKMKTTAIGAIAVHRMGNPKQKKQ